MRYLYMKKAVIFDLDGTLLNTVSDIANAVNAALWENGLPYRSVDEVRRFVGNGARKLIERCVEGDSSKYGAVMAAFESIYGEDCLNQTRPYSGVMQLLRRLKEDGYALGVLSNKPDFAVAKLCDHFFGGLLDFSVGQKDGVKVKPDPTLLLAELEAIGADKSETVYVGDGETDVECARAAGVAFVGVDWGYRSERRLRDAGAEKIACCPQELYKLIAVACDGEEE